MQHTVHFWQVGEAVKERAVAYFATTRHKLYNLPLISIDSHLLYGVLHISSTYHVCYTLRLIHHCFHFIVLLHPSSTSTVMASEAASHISVGALRYSFSFSMIFYNRKWHFAYLFYVKCYI